MDTVKTFLAHRKVGKNLIATLCLSALWLNPIPIDAQTQTSAHALSNSSYGTANGINDLAGTDPSKSICTTGRPSTDAAKMFCFYNEGSNSFLSIGGLWGTHASISNTPYYIWFEATNTDGAYYLNSMVSGSGTGTYMSSNNKQPTPDLYMDRGKDTGFFTFEKAEGYTDKNKVYRIKTTSNNATYYVTTDPSNTQRLCNIASKSYDVTDPLYKNQVWKVISKQDYYTLALANPATMKAVIDFSFLIQDAGFRINNATEAAAWKLSGANESTADINFGDATMYCTFQNRNSLEGYKHFVNYSDYHQQYYGKYAYCYSRKMRGFYMYQDIKVHKAGWYLLRCNGFSTQQAIEGEDKPLAYLFVAQTDNDGKFKEGMSSSSTLNVVSADAAKAMEQQSEGAGIGVAFFDGKYENQVQMCVETGDDGINPVSQDNPATLRVGYYVANGSTAIGDDEMTAVDNFKLLYAGPRRNPELILDENSTDLKYLTLANDDYTNSVLHLQRKFNDHQWNSLILPVDLTAGQMKRTFGDAVKVAKLARISNGTVFFVTQETQNDDDVLVKAFEPYIVYPPVVEVTSQSYTATKFYTSEDVIDNSEWLGTDYLPTNDESKALSKTIAADHYDITMVSLNKAKLLEHMNATKKDGEETWVSNTSFSAAAENGDMTCYGTLAKTFNENGIINGRDDLEEDYCIRNGNLVQVPKGYKYGLQGFRCWFEIKGKENAASAPLKLNIDGIDDIATSINDILGNNATFTSRRRGVEGVYSINGRLVRHGYATQGLPKGIYITNGRKVVVE